MKNLQRLLDEKELMKNIKEPLNLDDATFFQNVSKFPIVLVDFWAPWCGPCRMMSPIIDQIGKDYQGKLAVGKLNVDENPLIARQFGIASIPTLILFKSGQAIDKIVGSVSKNKINEMVKNQLDQFDSLELMILQYHFSIDLECAEYKLDFYDPVKQQ